jgi:hypothetical protein
MAFRGLTLGLMIGFEHAEEGAREFGVCDNVYVPTRTACWPEDEDGPK